jgi:hypothetical protein
MGLWPHIQEWQLSFMLLFLLSTNDGLDSIKKLWAMLQKLQLFGDLSSNYINIKKFFKKCSAFT